MSLDAACEVCTRTGPALFDDDMNIVCPKCHAAKRKPTHLCPVCTENKVPQRDDVCNSCQKRSYS